MSQDSDNKINFDIKLETEEVTPKSSGPEPSNDDSKRIGETSGDQREELGRRFDSQQQNPDKNLGLDRVNSTGYNPNASLPDTGATQAGKTSNLDRRLDSGLPNKDTASNVSNGGGSSPSTAQNSPRNVSDNSTNTGRKEQAPDVGKDYGDSRPQTPPTSGNVSGNGSDTPEDKTVPKDNGVNPAQAGVAPDETAGQEQGGLPPKDDGLTKDEKKPEEEGSNLEQKGDTAESANAEASGEKKPEEAANPEAPNNIDRDKIDAQNEQAAGNGYGALNKPNKEGTADGTDTARRNLEHSRRMQQGQREESGQNPQTPRSTGSINEDASPSIGSRIKSGFKNLLSGGGNTKNDFSDGKNSKNNEDAGKNQFGSALDRAKGAFMHYLATHPHVAIILCTAIIMLLILIITNLDGVDSSNTNGNRCTYNLNGILSTGSVSLEGIQVEIVNCDAKADNYTVLDTVDFEKYVVGVALAEVSYSNPEYFKSQIVAARNFALTRNKAMCPSHPDDCFYGYNPNTGKIRMRACTNDQVFCDYEKDCYRMTRDGKPALVSPEIDGSSGAKLWKRQPTGQLLENILASAEEVKGKVLLDDSGNVVYTNYIDKDQNEWYALAQQGYTYDQILSTHYGGGTMSGATCASGLIDYGDYVLSSDGHTILHEPLDQFLTSKGTSLEAFNGLIANNVQKAGYGTRAGVVAAAVTLIGELGNNYGVKVPYYWSGGHYDGVVDGALGYWGSSQCHIYVEKYNQTYEYCGLDCSGFVPWAIKNGGFDIGVRGASSFQNMSGAQRVNLSNSAVLQPGDLLESSGHVVLVVGIEESSGNYICAEASGNAAGVLFTRRPFNSSGYWGVKMDGYYETHKRSG